MNTTSFADLSQSERENINLMFKTLNETFKLHSLNVSFDSSAKRFTILGSSDLERGFVEKIFEGEKYSGWEPRVLEETDKLGNRIVQLQSTKESVLVIEFLKSAKVIVDSDRGYDEYPLSASLAYT